LLGINSSTTMASNIDVIVWSGDSLAGISPTDIIQAKVAKSVWCLVVCLSDCVS